jgi:diguanylate cyclase (GGDEF)-like protein
VFHASLAGHALMTEWGLACGCATVIFVGAFEAAGVTFAVALYERSMQPRLLVAEALRSSVISAAVGTITLVAIMAMNGRPFATYVVLAAAAMLFVGFRFYGALSDSNVTNEKLYHFSQMVAGAPQVDDVLRAALIHARDLLLAEHSEIALASGAGWTRVLLGPADELLRRDSNAYDDFLGRQVLEHGSSLLVPSNTKDPRLRSCLAAEGFRELVAAPLHGEAGVHGLLLVADRIGQTRTFAVDDLRLLEMVSNHTSVALTNGRLIERLAHDALHDGLTGLPNRTQLQRWVHEVLAHPDVPAAVMIMDLDGFKEVNDTLGHAYGDALLVDVAARLRSAVGADGMVARLGGDEFAVLLTYADAGAALAVAHGLLQALEHPIVLGDLPVEVGASIGISLAPLHGTDVATLLKRADIAMYAAKASPVGVCLYSADSDTSDPQRLALVGELRTALTAGELTVFAQPKAALASGEIVGVEGLLRWNHPTQGLLDPELFVPAAERSGLIQPLTKQVLETSVAACADWRAVGHEVGVAVNLSTQSLLDQELPDYIARLLDRYGVPRSALTLEITECSVMSEPTRAGALLQRLSECGIKLSLDDFGTGYSSLSYLGRLPVQEVKIDGSLISGMSAGSDDAAIVHAIVELGRSLGLQVVAEGVEDTRTWELLRSVGCGHAQGYVLAKPMPIATFAGWLRDYEAGTVTAGSVPRQPSAAPETVGRPPGRRRTNRGSGRPSRALPEPDPNPVGALRQPLGRAGRTADGLDGHVYPGFAPPP